jgi:hypothetical protein
VLEVALNLIIAIAESLLAGQKITANMSAVGLKELNCREQIVTPFGTFCYKLFQLCLLVLMQAYCVSTGRVS